MVVKRKPNPSFTDPEAFIKTLSQKMKDDGIYVADVGQNQIWSCAYHEVRNGRFMTSGGMGTMGYSIPAALGAKLAAPKKQVIAVCGDGSFQMSMMELATINQVKAGIKIIVLKNNYLGMVREYQHFTYKDNYSVVELNDYPNYKKLAEAYDMGYIKVENTSKAEAAIDLLLKDDKSCIMEVCVDPMDIVKG